MTTTTRTAKTEADHWREAVENSRTTITWLEGRNDTYKAEIRSLRARVKDLEGAR